MRVLVISATPSPEPEWRFGCPLADLMDSGRRRGLDVVLCSEPPEAPRVLSQMRPQALLILGSDALTPLLWRTLRDSAPTALYVDAWPGKADRGTVCARDFPDGIDLICPCRGVAERLRADCLAGARVRVMHPEIPSISPETPPPPPHAPARVLFAGRPHDPGVGLLRNAIRAVAELRGGPPGIAFYVMESTSLEAFAVECRAHGLVVLPRDDAAAAFALLHVAALCGVPVIALGASGPTEFIEDGRTGYAVRADRPRQLANRISRFINEPELGPQMAEALHRGLRRAAVCTLWDCVPNASVVPAPGKL